MKFFHYLFPLFVVISTFINLQAQVFINRDQAITSSEVFGISKPTSVLLGRFGGMYIETTGLSDSKPFYGYAINGDVKSYSYFDGNDNGVHLYNNGLKMAIWSDSMQWKIDEDTRLFYNGDKLEFGRNGNTYIGKGVTPSSSSSNVANTSVGWLTGRNLSSGVNNTLLGFRNGENITSGDWNTIVGSEAANNLATGIRNTMIGYRAGWNASITGSGNVFIGNRAGEGRRVNNKLIISNSETTTPLIEGDFASEELEINGEATVHGNTSVFGILSATSLVYGNSYKVNGTSPYIDFAPAGQSKFYIQYQPGDDELVVHRSGYGDVMKIQSNGRIFFPAMGGGAQSNLEIKATGELVKILPATEYEYSYLEEIPSPNISNANIIVIKDIKHGDVLTQLVIRSIWNSGIANNPTSVSLLRVNKISGAGAVIASLSNFGSGSYNQEFSTNFSHTVDANNYQYYLLTDDDSVYTYIKLRK